MLVLWLPVTWIVIVKTIDVSDNDFCTQFFMNINPEEFFKLWLPFLPQLQALQWTEVTSIASRKSPKSTKCIPSQPDATD